jgi:SAM-dependent methyltransferase
MTNYHWGAPQLNVILEQAPRKDTMANPDLEALVTAATAYEEFFVPALFQEWAPRVAAAAELLPGQRVLDVACGTGVLSRAAATCVGARGSVVGLDPNPGMLAVASQRNPEITWQEGTAEALPYPDASFDAVVSQFGLMFFADRLRALGEMLRVLHRGGHLAVAVWDSLDHTPAYAAVVALLERLAGASAADALRAPFELGNRKDLAALFAQAGVAGVTIATQRGKARFASPEAMVEADLRGWLPAMGVVLPEPQIRQIVEEAKNVLNAYVTPEQTIAFDIQAYIVTGTAP